LGEVVARRFHDAGYKVALSDVAVDAAEALARELSRDGSSAFAVRLDVTSKADFEAARDALLDRWGAIDALVNNAGASKVVPVMDITAEQFDQVIDVNLRSVLFGCQVFGQDFVTWAPGASSTLSRSEARKAVPLPARTTPRPKAVRLR
jgi:3-oxoacyl-[acyl-carrier protein] reductase